MAVWSAVVAFIAFGLVKLVVGLKEDFLGKVTAEDILSWSRSQMAAYKAPRLIEFSDALPRTASGKLMWRALQEKEFERKTA